MFVVQRMLGWLWILILIVTLLFSSMNLGWLFDFPITGSSGPSEATEVVEDDGFILELDGVTVSGDAAVAPAGTSITARLVTQDIPEAVDEFAEPIGTGVEVTLGDGMQPASPLTITFAPNEVAGWYETTSDSDDVLPVVLASKVEAPGVEFADAHVQADGSVVVNADHLSWFQPVRASVTEFAGWVVEQADIGMQVRSEMPACHAASSSETGWEFSDIPEQILWPCVSVSGSRVDATITLNSTGVWVISSQQAIPGYPSTLSLADIVVTTGALQVLDRGTTSPLLPPGASVTFSATSPGDEILFHAELNPMLTTINAVFSTFMAVTPGKKIEQIARAQCVIDAISESVTGVDAVDGNFVRMIVDCFGSVVGGMAGTFLGAITTGPTALATLFDGIHREITGRTEFSFTLSRIEKEPVATPSASAWPTARNDSVGGLYIWLGANGYDFPDWVACDDARDWCLVGNNGDWHVLISTDPLREVGSIHDTYADPAEALNILGVPADSISQILGD